MNTRTLFEKCVGRFFRVEALQQVEGLAYRLTQRTVGRVLGYENYRDTIWIEPQYLEPATPSGEAREASSKPDTTCPS